MSAREAFVTLTTTDVQCKGARVVAQCLRRHRTTRRIVVLVTQNISKDSRTALQSLFDEVVLVDVASTAELRRSWSFRPYLGVALAKIYCWTLTHYTKCVFLESDTLVLCNVDELFDRDELSAAPDPAWPDCFNPGVFVFRPSLHTHNRLLDHVRERCSLDGDHSLLNTFFSGWAVEDINKHLPFIYNLSTGSPVYTYHPAFHRFGQNAKIVRFHGSLKPWSIQRGDKQEHPMGRFINQWWKEYHSLLERPPAAHSTQHTQIQETVDAVLPHISSSCQVLHLPSKPQQMQYSTKAEEERPQVEEDQPESVELLLVEEGKPGELESSQVEEDTSENTDGAQAEEDKPTSTEWAQVEKEKPASTERAQVEEEKPGGPEGAQAVEGKPEEAERAQAEDTNPGSSERSQMDEEVDTKPVASETAEEQLRRRRQWEAGQVDYMGRDAFHNIQKKLDFFLE